jgi:hypothetical protein
MICHCFWRSEAKKLAASGLLTMDNLLVGLDLVEPS